MSEWLLFAVGLLLTVGTGFFVASEFTLVNLDRAELEAREERGERGLGVIISALKKTSTHLSSAQLGITLTTLLAGFTLEPAFSAWLSADGEIPSFTAAFVKLLASATATKAWRSFSSSRFIAASGSQVHPDLAA